MAAKDESKKDTEVMSKKDAPAEGDEAKLPEPVGDAKAFLVRSSHDTTEIDPAYAGLYELTHGNVRLGTEFYGKGVKLNLGHLDGYRMLKAGVVKRADGKLPATV